MPRNRGRRCSRRIARAVFSRRNSSMRARIVSKSSAAGVRGIAPSGFPGLARYAAICQTPKQRSVTLVGWAEPGGAGRSPCRIAPGHGMGFAGLSPSYDLEPRGRSPGGSRDPLCNILRAGRWIPAFAGIAKRGAGSARRRLRLLRFGQDAGAQAFRRSRRNTRRCPRDRPQARRPRPQARLADTQPARRRSCGSRERGTRSPDSPASAPSNSGTRSRVRSVSAAR